MLGLPASELVDLTLDAGELGGRAADSLGELVDAAASPEAALAGLQRRIVDRMADAVPPDAVVSEAVLRLTGVSPRVFLGQTEHTCACGHDHAASFTPLLRAGKVRVVAVHKPAAAVLARRAFDRVGAPAVLPRAAEPTLSGDERARLEANAPPPDIYPQRMLREQAGISDPAVLTRPAR